MQMPVKIEKKIFLRDEDDFEKTLKKALDSVAERVILNIPKNSVLGSSTHNFLNLKKEIIKAGKEIFIESVDDHILELAGLADIESKNPFFNKKTKIVSDVILKSPSKINLRRKTFSDTVSAKSNKNDKKSETIPKIPEDYNEPKLKVNLPHRRSMLKKSIVWISVAGLIFIGFIIAFDVLPRASISIVFKKTPVNFEETISVDNKLPKFVTHETIALPGELLTAKSNLVMDFESLGRERVSTSAKGEINIYNVYGSDSQSLVAKTRFQTSDGKVFRLNKSVIIPGAKISEGKIIPSSIVAEITADAPGESYNLASTTKFTIPGFSGSPKFTGFYGETKGPFSGGFIGERVAPTKTELELAKSKVREALESALKSNMSLLLLEKFKLFDDAVVFNFLKDEIQFNSEKKNNFGYFAEAEMKQLVFEETTLKEALAKKLLPKTDYSIKMADIKFEYIASSTVVDLVKGKMSFQTKGLIIYEPDFDSNAFINDSLGKKGNEIRASILGIPGIIKANVSLWPFWVKSVPTKKDRINLVID